MTVATEEMFAAAGVVSELPSKRGIHSLSMVFPKLNLFDLLLFSVLPTETMNNLRSVRHKLNGTLRY